MSLVNIPSPILCGSLSYLLKEEVLNCRTICHNWCRIVTQPAVLREWLESNGLPTKGLDDRLVMELFFKRIVNLPIARSMFERFTDEVRVLQIDESRGLSIFYALAKENGVQIYVSRMGHDDPPERKNFDLHDPTHYLILPMEERNPRPGGAAFGSDLINIQCYFNAEVDQDIFEYDEFFEKVASPYMIMNREARQRAGLESRGINWRNIGIMAATVIIAGLALRRFLKK